MAVACIPEKSPGVLLSESNLAELASDLHPVRAKWFLIGGHLRIKYGDLNAIHLERSDLSLRLHEVLRIWLTRLEPACVEDLIGALMKSNVNEQQLALALQEKYTCEVLAPCSESLPVATMQDKIAARPLHQPQQTAASPCLPPQQDNSAVTRTQMESSDKATAGDKHRDVVTAATPQIPGDKPPNGSPAVAPTLQQLSQPLKYPKVQSDMKPVQLSSGAEHSFTKKLMKMNNFQPKKSNRKVVIAILDTGIKNSHKAFTGIEILKESKNFTADKSLEDKDGHGTVCAGILAGKEYTTGDGFPGGIYSCSHLLILKIASKRDEYDTNNILKALEYLETFTMAGKTKPYVDVVSLSFGMEYVDTEMKDAFKRLRNIGTICVAAAGNSGRLNDRIMYPAFLSDVLSVGATEVTGEVSTLTSKGAVDVYAPGMTISAPGVDGNDSKLVTHNGTSCAAPAIAGVIGQVIHHMYYHFTAKDTADMMNCIHDLDNMKHILTCKQLYNSNSCLQPADFFENFEAIMCKQLPKWGFEQCITKTVTVL